jgi:hypothetical protein
LPPAVYTHIHTHTHTHTHTYTHSLTYNHSHAHTLNRPHSSLPPATPFFGDESAEGSGQTGGAEAGGRSRASATAVGAAAGAAENRVEADDKQPNCAGCGEPFETAYDEESEDWMYLEATRNPQDALLYHTKCLSTQPNAVDTIQLGSKRAASADLGVGSADAAGSADSAGAAADTLKRIKV